MIKNTPNTYNNETCETLVEICRLKVRRKNVVSTK